MNIAKAINICRGAHSPRDCVTPIAIGPAAQTVRVPRKP